jgi:hypothetical protein
MYTIEKFTIETLREYQNRTGDHAGNRPGYAILDKNGKVARQRIGFGDRQGTMYEVYKLRSAAQKQADWYNRQ